jgi:hypothetical protein
VIIIVVLIIIVATAALAHVVVRRGKKVLLMRTKKTDTQLIYILHQYVTILCFVQNTVERERNTEFISTQ